jgi:hypothetical protein
MKLDLIYGGGEKHAFSMWRMKGLVLPPAMGIMAAHECATHETTSN